MRAVAIHCFGGRGAVAVTDLPEPVAGPGDVRIEVAAVGLNPADWKLREGWLASTFVPHFPYAIGFDGAGTVESVGPDVTGLAPGDRVVAKTAAGRGGGGAAAQYVVVPQHLVCPIPDSLPFTDAATLPTAGITAWEAVFDTGGLQAGQTVLVNGGAGGTGAFAVQLARDIGARVFATCSEGNRAYVEGLGAEATIDYRSGDVAAALHDLCPGGVDLVVDTVGGGSLPDPLALVKDGGTIATIATLIIDEPRPDAFEAGRRRIHVTTASSSREREAGQLRKLVDLVAAGRIKPLRVEPVHPLDAADALERLRLGEARFKMVLTLDARVARGGTS